MAPSKWDDEESSSGSDSPPPVAARRKFDDEEDSDEVLDSWEAAEDSEVEREKAKKAAESKAKAEAEAAANKKSKAQRIKEHSARRKAEEDEESSDEEEDETSKRDRLRRTEQDADLAHAQDLIGDIDLNRKRSAPKAVVVSDSSDPTKAVDLSAMPLFKPVTKDQFANLTKTLIPLLTTQSKKPQFPLWVQEFTKQLVKDLNSADTKKVASALTTVSNEKMREEKAQEKGGKKSKAAKTKTSLVAARDTRGVDTTAYDGGDGLDDDDFM